MNILEPYAVGYGAVFTGAHQFILFAYAGEAGNNTTHCIVVNGPSVLAKSLFHLSGILQSGWTQNAVKDREREKHIKYLCGTLFYNNARLNNMFLAPN